MKYFVKFLVVTSFLFICTYSFAEQKIVYLDMKFVLNNSKAGKDAQDYLQGVLKKSQDKFNKIESGLKKEEQDLISKKNSLSKDDYKTKSDALRKKVIDYQKERKNTVDSLTKKRATARKQLLDTLNPIINTYVDENGVSLVIDKKDVVVGKADLDITNIIVEKLNSKLPSLNLK